MNRAEFYEALRAKGWTVKEVAERWNMHPGSLRRLAKRPSARDIDALKALPRRIVIEEDER